MLCFIGNNNVLQEADYELTADPAEKAQTITMNVGVLCAFV